MGSVKMEAAVLGLLGIPKIYSEAAGKITCPVMYMMQMEDELFTRDAYLEVFDSLATKRKRLIANPGRHAEMPASELMGIADFITSNLLQQSRSGSRAPQ